MVYGCCTLGEGGEGPCHWRMREVRSCVVHGCCILSEGGRIAELKRGRVVPGCEATDFWDFVFIWRWGKQWGKQWGNRKKVVGFLPLQQHVFPPLSLAARRWWCVIVYRACCCFDIGTVGGYLAKPSTSLWWLKMKGQRSIAWVYVTWLLVVAMVPARVQFVLLLCIIVYFWVHGYFRVGGKCFCPICAPNTHCSWSMSCMHGSVLVPKIFEQIR